MVSPMSASVPVWSALRRAGAPGVGNRVGLAVMLTGVFVTVMDTAIVNVAIPSIRTTLGATFAEAELVVAGYIFIFAIGMITGGRLGDIFGHRRVFLTGFAAFTLTSALCGLAPSPHTLILARLLQGAAASLLSPQVFSLVRLSFAEGRERTAAFAVMGVVLGLGNICGQIVGGMLLQANLLGLAWRPVFLVNVPIGVISLIVAPFALPKTGASTGRRLDVSGVLLATLGLGMLMYPLIMGRGAGWPLWSVVMLVGSPFALAVFFLHQRWKTQRNLQPLLDTSLLSDRAFALGSLVILIFFATMTPLSFSFTLLEQIGYGRSPMTSALDLVWLGGPAAISPLFAGRLIRAIGVRRVLIVGAAFDLAGLLIGLATCTLKHDFLPAHLIPSLLLQGIGYGLFMSPILNAVLSGIQDRFVGAAAGVLTTMQRGGNALGMAVLEIPFAATLDRAGVSGPSLSTAYLYAFMAVSGCIALMILAVITLLFRVPLAPPASPVPAASTTPRHPLDPQHVLDEPGRI
jgi:EmrB/QacA subfamily drug resistance transporter